MTCCLFKDRSLFRGGGGLVQIGEGAMIFMQGKREGGVHGVNAPPLPPQAPMVRILIFNVQAKEYSRLN